MKPKVKIAIITTIGGVLVAVITYIIPIVINQNDKKSTKEISVHGNQNVVNGEINTNGDVIINGNKTINIYLSLDYQHLLKEIEGLEQDLKDIPPDKIESRLNKSKKLDEKRKQLQDFTQEVLRLAVTFSKIEINTERLKQAQQYFTQGKFREADAILKAEELSHDQEHLLNAKESKNRELEELNEKLLSNANEFLIKAQITATNFNNLNRFQDACRFYEQSIRSYIRFDNLFEYAYFLQQHNQHNEAERYYQEAMKRFGRELDAPTRAMTLNNLGNLQQDKNEFEDALKSYKEALEIRRKLAQSNPQTYLPNVAMTLINLSIFYQKGQPDKDVSVQYAMEALKILTPFLEGAPYTQQYAQRARQVLQDWGVDIEKVLAEENK
ncbi:MAG: tetratricopeptide repeat protein [Planctomycetes bacterium]|nr:tetratricopeptide repeat protein [Planctomycetota bacterium]